MKNPFFVSAALIYGGFVSAALAVPPANDTIQNATAITSIPYLTDTDMADATVSATDPLYCGQPNEASLYNSVWYTYTGVDSQSLDLRLLVSPTSTTGQYLGIFTGKPGALTILDCAYISAFSEITTLRFTPTAGTVYYFEGAALDQMVRGDVTQLSLAPTPAANTGTITVGTQATAYNQVKIDPERVFFFYLQHHVTVSVQLTCNPDVPKIRVAATIIQGSSTASGGANIACTGGVGSGDVDLGPGTIESGYKFSNGAAVVNVTATSFDSNYSAQETGAATNVTVVKKPVW